MCGRFTFTVFPMDFITEFPGIEIPGDWMPRYNIAPTQSVAVISMDDPSRLQSFQWGMVPSWIKDIKLARRQINARAEGLAESKLFRPCLEKRRCLVLADGFFEWKVEAEAKVKTPMYIRLKSRNPFAFAGLWDRWSGPEGGEPLNSCVIITTAPNRLMMEIHDRMPVILSRESRETWLDHSINDTRGLLELLKPYPADEMESYEVSTIVNNVRSNIPQCVMPINNRGERDEGKNQQEEIF